MRPDVMVVGRIGRPLRIIGHSFLCGTYLLSPIVETPCLEIRKIGKKFV